MNPTTHSWTAPLVSQTFVLQGFGPLPDLSGRGPKKVTEQRFAVGKWRSPFRHPDNKNLSLGLLIQRGDFTTRTCSIGSPNVQRNTVADKVH